MKIKIQHTQTYGHNEGVTKKQVHSSEYIHKKKNVYGLLIAYLKVLGKKNK